MKVDLSSNIYSIPIKNPLVVGSSGLTSSADKVKKIEQAGAGAVIMKSIFEEEIDLQFKDEMQKLEGNDANLEFLDYYDYEIRKNALNEYCEEIKKAKATVDIPVIASINCISSGEWINYARPLQDAGADAIEINALFLPLDSNRNASDYEKMYFEIIENLKAKLSIPIGIKLSPYFSHLPNFVSKLAQHVDGISIFNRFYNPDININTNKITTGPIFSSSTDYYNTLRWMAILSNTIDKPMSATTGIHTPETMIKMLMAGASSTQVVSTFYLNGIKHINVMLQKLEEWMAEKNYNSLADFKGILKSDINKHNRFERIQFMKYFGSGSGMIDI